MLSSFFHMLLLHKLLFYLVCMITKQKDKKDDQNKTKHLWWARKNLMNKDLHCHKEQRCRKDFKSGAALTRDASLGCRW